MHLFLIRLLRRDKDMGDKEMGMGDEGMGTAEYAICTIAAAAFAAVLYGILTGDHIIDKVTALISDSLEEP